MMHQDQLVLERDSLERDVMDDEQGAQPEAHHQHRNVSGGSARAAIFGVSDGLVSNVAIVLGFAGASTTPGLVRLAGVAGLVGGAVSMAAGEYASTTAQAELLFREIETERKEIANRPDLEAAELEALYRDRGIDSDVVQAFVSQLMADPDLALRTHAREELGVDNLSFADPKVIALWSLMAFALGAVVPLLPWFFGGGAAAVIASVTLTAVGALAVGATLARFTGRPTLAGALRQLMFAAVPAALTYAIGSAVGVGVTG